MEKKIPAKSMMNNNTFVFIKSFLMNLSYRSIISY